MSLDPILQAKEERIEQALTENSEKPPPNQKLKIRVLLLTLVSRIVVYRRLVFFQKNSALYALLGYIRLSD